MNDKIRLADRVKLARTMGNTDAPTTIEMRFDPFTERRRRLVESSYCGSFSKQASKASVRNARVRKANVRREDEEKKVHASRCESFKAPDQRSVLGKICEPTVDFRQGNRRENCFLTGPSAICGTRNCFSVFTTVASFESLSTCSH